ncbi:hypothetical protein F5Y16DRAFT_363620 [Xylariaceae sp. FL0255]|nr:hypothetical protein F5Y16DRAFT_363620 [Xylariaceae sp. FL0255]
MEQQHQQLRPKRPLTFTSLPLELREMIWHYALPCSLSSKSSFGAAARVFKVRLVVTYRPYLNSQLMYDPSPTSIAGEEGEIEGAEAGFKEPGEESPPTLLNRSDPNLRMPLAWVCAESRRVVRRAGYVLAFKGQDVEESGDGFGDEDFYQLEWATAEKNRREGKENREEDRDEKANKFEDEKENEKKELIKKRRKGKGRAGVWFHPKHDRVERKISCRVVYDEEEVETSEWEELDDDVGEWWGLRGCREMEF